MNLIGLLAEQSRMAGDMGALARVAAGEGSGGQEGAASFSAAMMDAVRSVDADSRVAGEKMADVDSGRSDDLVGAMLMSQEASLSFSMLMQVRNKVVGAVDDLIKMQV